MRGRYSATDHAAGQSPAKRESKRRGALAEWGIAKAGDCRDCDAFISHATEVHCPAARIDMPPPRSQPRPPPLRRATAPRAGWLRAGRGTGGRPAARSGTQGPGPGPEPGPWTVAGGPAQGARPHEPGPTRRGQGRTRGARAGRGPVRSRTGAPRRRPPAPARPRRLRASGPRRCEARRPGRTSRRWTPRSRSSDSRRRSPTPSRRRATPSRRRSRSRRSP